MTEIGDLLVEFKEKPGVREEPPVLTLTERKGFIRQVDRFNKRLATEDVRNYKVVRRNDIAFNPYLLWAGAVAQNTIVDKGIISPLYPTFRVRDGHDPRYVARLLLTPQLISSYDGIAFGSVPRRRRSTVQDFLSLPLLNVPTLTGQRRIASILDHADALRAKRRQVLAHLDALTQSVFTDMFGDLPAGRWDRVPFGELIPQVENGTSPNCEARPAESDEWAVLKLGAVSHGHFRPEENKAYLGHIGSMAKNEVRSGDILMTRKNTRELVGSVALVGDVPPKLLLPDLIFRLHLNGERLDRSYFHALMMSPQKRSAVRDLSSGSASSMPNISKARLARLPLELPPLALQREFRSRVALIGAQRTRVADASAADATLFASVQSRAFRGEL